MKNWSIKSKLFSVRDPGTSPKRRVQQLAWPQDVPTADVTRFGKPPEIIPPIAVAHRIVVGINEHMWLNIDMDGDFRPLLKVYEITFLDLLSSGDYLLNVTRRVVADDKASLNLSLHDGNFTPILRPVESMSLNIVEAGRYVLFETGIDKTQGDSVSSAQSLFDGEYFQPHESDELSTAYAFVRSPYDLIVIAAPSQVDNVTCQYLLVSSPYDLVVVTAPTQSDQVTTTYTLIQSPYVQVVKTTSITEASGEDTTFIGGTVPTVVQATGLLVDGAGHDSSFDGGSVT